jgi:tocopherol O-methyltransferase
MKQTQEIERVRNFYNDVHFLFVESGADSTHFGLWETDTQNYRQAAKNLNRFVADLLQVQGGDRVLDAGCGLGGTSLFIAQEYAADVVGINIADKQLKAANKLIKRCSNVEFQKRSFLDTGFEDVSFNKVFGIESVCYAIDKKDFMKEAFRLLIPGGRLVVCDAFVVKENRSIEEEQLYRTFADGFSVPDFAAKSEFERDLMETGFKNIVFYDKITEVQKQFVSYYRMGLLLYPLAWLISKFEIMPQAVKKMVTALVNSKKFFNTKISTYGAFVADKP